MEIMKSFSNGNFCFRTSQTSKHSLRSIPSGGNRKGLPRAMHARAPRARWGRPGAQAARRHREQREAPRGREAAAARPGATRPPRAVRSGKRQILERGVRFLYRC